jgi:hypothetical protein
MDTFLSKNFAWCLVPFCKMMGQKPKKFWVKWGTKHTLKIKNICYLEMLFYLFKSVFSVLITKEA